MDRSTGSALGGPHLSGIPDAEAARARTWDLVAAIAGLVFVALVVASFFTPETPGSDAGADVLAARLTEDLTGHQVWLLLAFLGDVAFLVFLAGMWSRLRRWEGVGGLFAGLFAIAGAVFMSLVLVSEGIYVALVQAAAGGDPATLPTLALLDDWVGFAVLPAGVALFLGAAGAIRTTRALPGWLGWLAALTAGVLVVSFAGVFQTGDDEGIAAFAGFAGFLLFLVWTLAASVLLLLRAGRAPEGAAGPAAAAAG